MELRVEGLDELVIAHLSVPKARPARLPFPSDRGHPFGRAAVFPAPQALMEHAIPYKQGCREDEAVRDLLLSGNFTAAVDRLHRVCPHLADNQWLEFQLLTHRFMELASLARSGAGKDQDTCSLHLQEALGAWEGRGEFCGQERCRQSTHRLRLAPCSTGAQRAGPSCAACLLRGLL
jgi:hypothetical protein